MRSGDPTTDSTASGVQPSPSAGPRSRLRAVALPAEHGGWGLTLEPVLLGLLVAPSSAGLALGAGALTAFLARTPVKLALVDRWRRRRLPRTMVAQRVAVIELLALAGFVTVAAATTARSIFWVPLAIAAPLVAVELWFDMRSRSRRLLPELAGTIGIGSVVAAMVLADGGPAPLAAGAWLIITGRALASVPFVRVQLARSKQRPYRFVGSDAAQAAAVAVGAVAVALDDRLRGGLVALALLAVLHLMAARRDPPRAMVLGLQQTLIGLAIVAMTGIGVRAL